MKTIRPFQSKKDPLEFSFIPVFMDNDTVNAIAGWFKERGYLDDDGRITDGSIITNESMLGIFRINFINSDEAMMFKLMFC